MTDSNTLSFSNVINWRTFSLGSITITDWDILSTGVNVDLTFTFFGFFNNVSANLITESGIVAEKNKVCLFAGNILTTFWTSRMKPISSILSASSRTKNCILSNEQKPWFMRSKSLPGVATIISTPLFNNLTCGPCLTPPKITVCLSGTNLPYFLIESLIWIANSLVGARITALGKRNLLTDWSALSFCNIGNVKAAVLPVPVWAMPSISKPCKAEGIVSFWIGVGVV